jgi:hypothetical protein
MIRLALETFVSWSIAANFAWTVIFKLMGWM